MPKGHPAVACKVADPAVDGQIRAKCGLIKFPLVFVISDVKGVGVCAFALSNTRAAIIVTNFFMC